MAKAGKDPGAGVEPADTVGEGAHPDVAQAVFCNIVEPAARQARRVLRIGKIGFEAVAVIAVEPVAGGQPDKAAAVLQDVEHVAVREAVGRSEVLEVENRGLGREQKITQKQDGESEKEKSGLERHGVVGLIRVGSYC